MKLRAFGICAVLTIGLATIAHAQWNTGDAVSILIPTSANQPEPDPGPPTDVLVFTGGKIVDVDATGCQPGSFPRQPAVLVDPEAGRGNRTVDVIALTGEPAPPGTRLISFGFVADCTAEGTTYKRYTAVVE